MSTSQPEKTRDKLARRFPGKQINRMISFRRLPRPDDTSDPLSQSKPTCPLAYTERLVYSFLLFRCKRKGKHIPASISRLARLSNLHRSTVKKALEGLATYRLVVQKPNGWELVTSDRNSRLRNPEWYGFRSEEITVGQLGYHYFVQPDKGSGIKIIESLVMVADLLARKKSSACLAGRFGVHRKTIQRARARGLASAENLNSFKDVQFKQKPKKPLPQKGFLANLSDPFERRLAGEMLNARVPLRQEEVIQFIAEIQRRHTDPTKRMFFYMALLGDDTNADKKKTLRDVLATHSGSKSWLELLRHRLGWGSQP